MLDGGIELLKRSDIAVTVTVSGWDGSVAEVEFCRKNNIPLYHSNGHFESFGEYLRKLDCNAH